MDPLRGFQPARAGNNAEHAGHQPVPGTIYHSTQTKSGIVIIDQQNAHERILYDKLHEGFGRECPGSQRLLMPQTYNSRPSETPLLEELSDTLKELGFDISVFGKDTFLIHAVPQGTTESEVTPLLESVLEDYKKDSQVSSEGFENPGFTVTCAQACDQKREKAQNGRDEVDHGKPFCLHGT